MSGVKRTVVFVVGLALAAQAHPAASPPVFSQTAEPARPRTLVVMIADESLYLCPLCGETFLAAYRRLASRHGKDGVWVVVSPGPLEDADDASLEAAAKRIRVYLRSNGCPAPVLLDRNGFFRAEEAGTAQRGFVLDASSGSVESLASGPPVTTRNRQ